MLILTRRVGEILRIGDHVVVAPLGINGNQVKMGIEAPKDVAVDREEIYRSKQKGKVGVGAQPVQPPISQSASQPANRPISYATQQFPSDSNRFSSQDATVRSKPKRPVLKLGNR